MSHFFQYGFRWQGERGGRADFGQAFFEAGITRAVGTVFGCDVATVGDMGVGAKAALDGNSDIWITGFT